MHVRASLFIVALAVAAIAEGRSITSAAAPVLASGSGVIQSVAPNRVIVVLHMSNRRADDGVVDHVFRFWSASSLPALNVSFESASVHFDERTLTIMDSDQSLFYSFTVNAPEQGPRGIPNGFTGATYVGYGLNHQIGGSLQKYRVIHPTPGSHFVTVSLDDDCGDHCILNLDLGNDDSGSGTCDSGGIGASACSATNSSRNTSCSVQCSSGYYACCNKGSYFTDESCKCKKY
jgi:hypothetical protein